MVAGAIFDQIVIHSEPYEVAAMATETRNKSASLAKASRSFFTDPAGLLHSMNEDTGSSRSPEYV